VALYVTNTMTRRKERFEPLAPPDVKMYVCGVNLYGPAHVGHALSYVFFDVVRRHLEWSGYRVRHIQNFTDIEDRIVARAREEGRSVWEIAEEHIERFHREMASLNALREAISRWNRSMCSSAISHTDRPSSRARATMRSSMSVKFWMCRTR